MTLIVRTPISLGKLSSPVVVTVGNFDGVHIGHRSLLSEMSSLKMQGGTSVVVSFYPHPAVVLGKVKEVQVLTTQRQKLRYLKESGVDVLYNIHFTDSFASLDARDFIETYIKNYLKASKVVLGPDAAFGKGRTGDISYIKRCLEEFGISVTVVPFTEGDGGKIGSRAIRSLVQGGDVLGASKLLGRRYALDARVVHGAGRGEKLGFKTANLHTRSQVIPKLGVYATLARIGGELYPSVTNVGVRPTFEDNGRAIVESHLLSPPPSSLYGERVELEFVERIRDEKKFSGIEDLKKQIFLDIEKAKQLTKALYG